ncbi:MAG: hypothetical protein V1894_04925 [Chloroflexota bacterium]
MSNYEHRKGLFQQLKDKRRRDILALVTSTKQPEEHFAAQIALDLLPLFYSLLKNNGQIKELDLLVYSSGGQIDAPWALVNLIREFYDNLCVIVPSRAHSAATLIAIGADSIEMSPMGTLSPIDPQLMIKPAEPGVPVRTGIEDIYGYYQLIEEKLKLDSTGKTEALKLLANRIGPEILGQTSRIRNEIRIIATNLLSLHMNDPQKIETIVSGLIEKLHSHQYMIGRKEASKFGLPVKNLDAETEEIVSKILISYISEAEMDEPGLEINFAPSETKKTININRAFVENEKRSFVFRTQYTIYTDGKLEKRVNKWMEQSNG